MATYRKNIAVGLTMLVALVLLGTMIMLFGDAPIKLFRGDKIKVTFLADSASNLSSGSAIFYRGVSVGQVEDAQLTNNRDAVEIPAQIDAKVNVPANVVGIVRSSFMGGTATIDLELTGPAPEGTLSAGARIPAHLGSAGLLPQEFIDLAKDVRALVAQINQNKLADKVAVAVDKVGVAVESANKTFVKVGDAVDDLRKLLGDQKLQTDIRETVASFRTVSESAKTIAKNLETFSQKLNKLSGDGERVLNDISGVVTRTGARVDEMSKALTQRMDQVAGVLDRMQSIASKIDKGDGTAGKLINDGKLYESLSDTAAELHLTIRDLRRLVQQWEQEGVSLRLGK
jgi:phospholipid/cholesterol/gamma-HCH transport system substrate-binding protein